SPVNLFIADKTVSFRFCLSLAINEFDTLESLRSVMNKAFTDERYIQIDDKPVMVVIGSGDAEDARRLEQLKSVLMDSVFIIASGFANVVADN
ncbi:hypothetical protein, partial [Pseudomonas viridiflava]|uniref:hypothetical protein n=1 Tax=Pseudomonas viridiflava TaxID=33069 RepID=UPI0019825C59